MSEPPAEKNAELAAVQETIGTLQDRLARTGRVEVGFHHGFLVMILAICGTFAAVALSLVVRGEGDEDVAGWLMVVACAVPALWAVREWRTGRPVLVVDQRHVGLPRRGLEIPWSAVLGAWTQYQSGGGANVKIRVDQEQFPHIRKPLNVPGFLAVDESAIGWWLGREASARRQPAPGDGPAEGATEIER